MVKMAYLWAGFISLYIGYIALENADYHIAALCIIAYVANGILYVMEPR